MVIAGTIGLFGYGLFVSCLDRKRVDYVLAGKGVLVAAIGLTIAIHTIMSNLYANRSRGLAIRSESSWLCKRIFAISQGAGIILGVLVYLGVFDIHHKPLIEYLTVISTSLFFATFAIDFAKFKTFAQLRNVQDGT